MTKSKTSLTTANKTAVTRSFSLPLEVDLKLTNFMTHRKRSRSSVITEALSVFLSKTELKDQN